VLLTPADRTPKKIVLSLVKRNKGPLVKHTFCMKHLHKWVQKPSPAPAFSHEAHLPRPSFAMSSKLSPSVAMSACHACTFTVHLGRTRVMT
jgi:hypothetical protein